MESQPFDFSGFLNSATSLDGALAAYGVFLSVLFFCAFVLYALFSAVVVRQVYLMDNTIKTPLAPVLKIIAWAHLAVSLFITLMVFTAL